MVIEPLNSYALRYDMNAPVPYIHSIDPYGEVKIRFNSTMAPEAALNKTEIYTPGRRLKNIDFDEVLGVPTSSFRNFSLIHNSTVRINGTDYPSLSISLKPFNPEDSCASHLNFVWYCKNFTKEELILQLDFAIPGCVSSSTNEGDILVVTFSD